MKALLLRVGIDRGCGGCLGPIFDDGSFEYIPIPERGNTSENRTYSAIAGRNGRILADFIPANLHSSPPHFDPEFETFTYGDPTRNKRRQLLNLNPKDLLIFYAGLCPVQKNDISRLFIIGYFEVEHVYDFDKITESNRKSILAKFSNNAHVKRANLDAGLVIVKGKPGGSRLLERAIPLGNGRNCVMADLADVTGYQGSVLRAIGHWIDEQHIPGLNDWLSQGPSALIQEGDVLYSYVLASDTGFAPNPAGGYCTLACCKPAIRENVREGDWVMGTLPARHGRNRLGYIMRVNEVLTFNSYFDDDRFQYKKPGDGNPHGDNIYYMRNGKFGMLENIHHRQNDLEHDTQSDSVLVSSLFWYFGDQSPELPSRFEPLIKKGPNCKKEDRLNIMRELVSWVSDRYRIGILGDPIDRRISITGNCNRSSRDKCNK